MKKGILCLGSAVLLGAVSCKEKPKETGTTVEDKPVVESVVEKVKDVVAPPAAAKITDEERAAKLGFAKHLPADTEMAMSFYNAEQATEDLKALKLVDFFAKANAAAFEGEMEEGIIEDGAADEAVEELQEAEQAEDEPLEEPGDGALEGEEMGAPPSPWTLLGREITFAMGKTAGVQTGHLLTVSQRMGYFQAKAFGKAAQAYAKSGEESDFEDVIQKEMGTALLKNLLEDSESGIALWEKAQMPPLYMAFRAKEGELEQAAQLVSGSMGMFAMAGEMAAPVEFETGGGKFAGYKILGEEVAKMMEAEKDDMAEEMGAKNADGIIAGIRKKNLIFATGTVGEYVVVLIGGSEDSFKLAADVKDSLVASGGLNFVDAYADKRIHTLMYGEKELWDTLIDAAGGLSSYALGLRDGIAGGGGLGETRDIEEMLQIVADREKELLALGSASDLGLVAFSDQGLKIECFGGYDKGSFDWGAKTKLAHLGAGADNMLFLNIPGDATYDKKMSDYLESLVEMAYAATVKFSELEIDAPELEEMKQYTQLFDTQFREDVVGLWGALSTSMSDGLGNEMALVIDLKGSMPAIPGIPQKVVDEAKAPRMTLMAPVKDRAKLKESWEKVNTHTTSLLAKVSEMSGEKIPMQKPVSSEKDGMTTWFFSMPFFQDDFLPSVTVSDEWFAASTSKTQATELMSKAKAGGETGEGVVFRMNFTAMNSYASDMLGVIDRNAAEIFPDEFQLNEFKENKDMIKSFIEASGEFDTLTWTARKENGTVRNSLHFKTK